MRLSVILSSNVFLLLFFYTTGDSPTAASSSRQHPQRAVPLARPVPASLNRSIRSRLGKKAVARGYTTNQQVPVAPNSGPYGNNGGASGNSFAPAGASASSAGFPAASSGGADFNPILLGGRIGNPGIRARINQRGFQYAGTLIGPLLNSQIKNARIPPLHQCIPQLNGCINVNNLYIARYRCAQRIVLYPSPPNQIVISVQNVDVGVTGNLGGRVNLLVPLGLSGIIQLDAHQVSITVALTISRGPNGAPSIQVAACNAQIGYVDVYIQNGGLIGEIANNQLRGRLSQQVKRLLPSQLCGRLPSIVNEQLNGRLGAIPQSIALTQILQIAGGALGLSRIASQGQCTSSGCGGGPSPATLQTQPVIAADTQRGAVAPPPADNAAVVSGGTNSASPPGGQYTGSRRAARVLSSGGTQSNTHPITSPKLVVLNGTRQVRASDIHQRYVVLPPLTSSDSRHKRHAPLSRPRVHGAYIDRAPSAVPPPSGFAPAPEAPVTVASVGSPSIIGGGVAAAPGPSSSAGSSAVGAASTTAAQDPCSSCPNAGSGSDTGSIINTLVQSLDLNKLNNILLNVQLLGSSATTNDFTVDLNGEFSPNAQGGTPFGAFPMTFPPASDRMAEILISDFTVNSLFYHLHRVGFITIRLGPETPSLGPLLKTTCSEDEEGLEDHGVETDEESSTPTSSKKRRIIRHALRPRRQDDNGGGIGDLGICFGDLLPAIREKYPNRQLAINIHTAKAPSLIFSERNGGTATGEIVADADITIDGTGERVGTITVTSSFDITVQSRGNTLTGHAEITQLRLTDSTGTLGLTQDTLDNLGNLGKDLVQKAANDMLEKGISLSIPPGVAGLPINFVNPQFRIVDHALHLSADLSVAPSAFATLGISSGGDVCPARKRLH